MNLTVNGEPVSKEAVEREYQRLLKALGTRLAPGELARRSREFQRRAVDYAIGRLLLLGEARRREIRVAPAEIDRAVAELARACGGDAGLQAHLQTLKISPADLRRQILEARQTERLIEQVTADCPRPTEDEITAYLKDHAHEFMSGDNPPDSPPPIEAIRQRILVLLTAAGKNDLLSAFIARLKKNAVIMPAQPFAVIRHFRRSRAGRRYLALPGAAGRPRVRQI